MAAEKRKANTTFEGPQNKRAKAKNLWHSSNRDGRGQDSQVKREIEPGMAGIWVSCDMGKERRCEREMLDLFEEYAEDFLPAETTDTEAKEHKGDVDGASAQTDVEADIQKELDGIRHPQKRPLFLPIRVDTQCRGLPPTMLLETSPLTQFLVIFFQTSPPIEPVSFVQRICRDAASKPQCKRSRFAKRLTPITLCSKATEVGLEHVAKQVLAPHFHGEDVVSKKFAIRPNLRNHNILSRDRVINQVASTVGSKHKVDLKGYDVLILVEIYKNICGMSVVSNDFEDLKRYNLAELFQPTAKTSCLETRDTGLG